MGGSSAPADAGNYTALLVSSLIVLAIIALAVFALTRWRGGRLSGLRDSSGLIRVRARLSLEPRRTIYVVTVGDKTLLLGSSEQSINVLTDLSTDELPAEPPPPLSFADLVRNLRTSRGSEPKNSKSEPA
jgi:flagellar biosynthetic protein FliO